MRKHLFKYFIGFVILLTINFLISCSSSEKKDPKSDVSGEQKDEAICQAFQKHSDGSWSSISSTTIQGPNGSVQINPGLTFRKGVVFMGIELATWLDENCSKK